MGESDTISRQAAIDALKEYFSDEDRTDTEYGAYWHHKHVLDVLRKLPTAQPEPCEDKLKEIAEALSEKMCYMNTCLNERDIILGYLGVKRPSETHCNSDCRNEKCESYHYATKKLPSAQPERTCVNCGRTANNGGWYADGGTRCPIEEHYALPKDGYCHLWEKRNVTDDDYQERREG